MEGKRVLIYGFGEAGKQILKDSHGRLNVVGFVDDNPNLKGQTFLNVPVLGTGEELEKIVSKYNVDSVIIAIPSAPIKRIREIQMHLLRLGVRDIKILPVEYVDRDRVYLRQVVDIDPSELIGDTDFHVDMDDLRNYFREKRILITGGAGYIGYHIVKFILDLEPRSVVALDIDETRLFELKQDFPDVNIFLGDITRVEDLRRLFERHAPVDVVFHAAAYKHVPLLEDFPWKAIEVNVYGTRNLVEISKEYGVGKFVFISTDKAVNPVGIMGMSKRIAEEVVRRSGYISVRFVNVIGSRGSVLPLFMKQIERERKITITHEDATRYFMDVRKAVFLIFYAAIMGRGGEVFFLKPSKPLRIKELAEKLIRLYGYEPGRDVKIEMVGLRKGEKVEEEIFEENGNLLPTSHPMIFRYESLPGVEDVIDTVREKYGMEISLT